MDRIVLKPELRQITALHTTTIWRAQRRGEFPPFERLSPGRVGILESNLRAWLAGRRSGWSRGG